GDADQVVDGGGDTEPGPVSLSASVAEFSAAADDLDPAEGFLDPFSDPLADGVPDVSGGATVDGGAVSGGVRRDVRGEPECCGVGDEPSGVVALVGGDGASPGGGGEPAEHLDGGGPLGVGVGGGEVGVDDQR